MKTREQPEREDALMVTVTRAEYLAIAELEHPADVADYEAILGKSDGRAVSILAAAFHGRDVFVRIGKVPLTPDSAGPNELKLSDRGRKVERRLQ